MWCPFVCIFAFCKHMTNILVDFLFLNAQLTHRQTDSTRVVLLVLVVLIVLRAMLNSWLRTLAEHRL
jgi:hypothetical protein